MALDPGSHSVLFAALVGLLASIAIERLMLPRPSLKRAWSAWALHGGLWLSMHALLTFTLGRPWFAAAGVSAVLLLVVLVNNAKMKALREPFVFQDYEYFTDAVRHPRLYIPFLGWSKFFGAVAGFALAVSVGFWGETPITHLQLFPIMSLLGAGLALLLAGSRTPVSLSFKPEADLRKLGLLASLWHYGALNKHLPTSASPFDFVSRPTVSSDLPHMVAVQSESFFDPRANYSGIRPDVLAEWDRLKADALACGKLRVPAWGANTVRTEFAFLSGIDENNLGVHRFNAYRALAAGWKISSIASFMKRLGYRTVCIHPYPASFYRRDRVYPSLGFDEFLDIRAFENYERCGPYVGDAAVAGLIEKILERAGSPVFVLAITMENHGPLHLEKATHTDEKKVFSEKPPSGYDELTIYLRHLCNADKMVKRLRTALERSTRPSTLCWYGDHVPILPSLYEHFGAPDGEVEYVIWANKKTCVENRIFATESTLPAAHLSLRWLQLVFGTPN